MTDVFSRLAPYIQDYIYASRWTELRDIQISACRVVFDSDDNLLLSSGTASGKTEAAFLPVLTELYRKPSASVGVLYISPLKALINDQFKRLEYLLQESGLPVCKWHGDASAADKNRLLKHPQGILQITPESLESLLIRKRGACLKLFSDLRFVIIDEVHYFMRDVRGVQVLCLLERLQRITGQIPRRIGLSATLGDLEEAKKWLDSGTQRACTAVSGTGGRQKIRLFVERFQKTQDDPQGGSENSGEAEHFKYLYKMTLDQKTIIFTNSREETESVLAHLRQLALKYKTPDVYRVHHGNISAVLREQAEDEMKNSEEKLVTGATVTAGARHRYRFSGSGSADRSPGNRIQLCPAPGPLRKERTDSADPVYVCRRRPYHRRRQAGTDELELSADDRHNRIIYKTKMDRTSDAWRVSVFAAVSSDDELSAVFWRNARQKAF